jgi:large subunit ribosomal protein L10e
VGLRPGKCFRRIKRAYSRIATKRPKKNFVGAAPGLKIRQFNMGNPMKEFDRIVNLVVDDHVQIRDNAMESSRMAINRYLEKRLSKEAYFMKIRAYPNHFLREKKQATGAGADRVSSGMSHAFGKATGRAVQTRPGQVLISILVDEKNTKIAETGLMRANTRMPAALYTDVRKDVESIGTKPKKMRITKAEKKEAEEDAEKKAENTKGKDGKKAKDGETKAEDKSDGKKEEAKGNKKDAKK